MACAPAGVAASRLDGMVATEKSNFVLLQNHQKTQFVGVQTIKKVKKKSALWGTHWGQWKTTPKIHFDRYLRGFFGGVTAPTLSLFSFIWLYLTVFCFA